jgi:hypothetical protein
VIDVACGPVTGNGHLGVIAGFNWVVTNRLKWPHTGNGHLGVVGLTSNRLR